jgi:hypothetical protein
MLNWNRERETPFCSPTARMVGWPGKTQPERQDLAMTERSTSFAQQEIPARLGPAKGELIDVAKNNF